MYKMSMCDKSGDETQRITLAEANPLPPVTRHDGSQTDSIPTYQTRDCQTRKYSRQAKETQIPLRKDRATHVGYNLDSKQEITGCGPVSFQQKSTQTIVQKNEAGIQCQMSLSHLNSVNTQVWSRRRFEGEEEVGPVCLHRRNATTQADTLNLKENMKGIEALIKNLLGIIDYLLDQPDPPNPSRQGGGDSQDENLSDLDPQLQDILKNVPDLTADEKENCVSYRNELTYPKTFCLADMHDPKHYDCRVGERAMFTTFKTPPPRTMPTPPRRNLMGRRVNKGADTKFPHNISVSTASLTFPCQPLARKSDDDDLVDSFRTWSPFASNPAIGACQGKDGQSPYKASITDSPRTCVSGYTSSPGLVTSASCSPKKTSSDLLPKLPPPPNQRPVPTNTTLAYRKLTSRKSSPGEEKDEGEQKSATQVLTTSSLSSPVDWSPPPTSFTMENEVALHVLTAPSTKYNASAKRQGQTTREPTAREKTAANSPSTKTKTSVLNSICNQFKKLTSGASSSHKATHTPASGGDESGAGRTPSSSEYHTNQSERQTKIIPGRIPVQPLITCNDTGGAISAPQVANPLFVTMPLTSTKKDPSSASGNQSTTDCHATGKQSAAAYTETSPHPIKSHDASSRQRKHRSGSRKGNSRSNSRAKAAAQKWT